MFAQLAVLASVLGVASFGFGMLPLAVAFSSALVQPFPGSPLRDFWTSRGD